MPLIRFPTVKGLVYTIDLTKIADRANPRTVEAAISSNYAEDIFIDWGDGTVELYTKSAGVTWPEHTYDGADNIFTVVIRSASGHLPSCYFCYGQQENARKITKAVVSIDHFSGKLGTNQNAPYNFRCYYASNLKYCDPRFAGLPEYSDLYYFFRFSGVEQPLESFCFDFTCANPGQFGFSGTFFGAKVSGTVKAGFIPKTVPALSDGFGTCPNITAIATDALDQNAALLNIQGVFRGCTGLSTPYVFWNEDGSIDTTRFPNLTADKATNAYSFCTIALRAQVPEAYGGTMTVS